MKIAGYIITKDEEAHIAEAVASLKRVASTVLVLDSGSSDETVQKAAKAGAAVSVREFTGYSDQRNAAVDQLMTEGPVDWIVSIDADEVLADDLVTELLRVLSANSADAFLVRLTITFSGRRLRFGGTNRTRLLRVFRPSAGAYEPRDVNEHFELRPGARLATLQGKIEHRDVTSWNHHVDKHNRYSTMEAEARLRLTTGAADRVKVLEAIRKPHLRRRWLRESVFNRLPGKPVWRFVYLYVVLGGFLDGRAGFRYALFNSWQEMMIELKYEELKAGSRLST